RELPSCKTLILTTFGRPGFLRRAMENGASGFMLKDAPAHELALAIRRTMAGERVAAPGLAAATLSAGISPLSEREREVLVGSHGRAALAVAAIRDREPATNTHAHAHAESNANSCRDAERDGHVHCSGLQAAAQPGLRNGCAPDGVSGHGTHLHTEPADRDAAPTRYPRTGHGADRQRAQDGEAVGKPLQEFRRQH